MAFHHVSTHPAARHCTSVPNVWQIWRVFPVSTCTWDFPNPQRELKNSWKRLLPKELPYWKKSNEVIQW